MATLLYVHGTGVREPEYSKSFEHISESISAHQLEIKVAPCYWGGVYGAHLHHEGVSIPSYSETRSLACEDERDQDVVLWSILYQDPLYEFRLLASRSDGTRPFVPGRTSPLEALDDTVRTLTLSPELREKLGHGDVEVACFNEARKRVSASRLYREALSSVPPTSVDAPTVVARALVAQSIALCDEAGHVVRLSLDAALRDEIVGLLAEALGAEHYRAIGSWLKRQLGTFGQHIATRKIRRERGALTDRAYPLVGDILRYQGRGEEIRGFIRERIEEVKPPVGLLAHSLGGIACVDLLVLEDLPKVKLLVTVGSQAPFLYEIDALYSLPNGMPLPEYFPAWLNIYDPRDFLSYVGEGLFPGRVRDAPVDNRQPFPRSHSAYWYNALVWQEILQEVARCL